MADISYEDPEATWFITSRTIASRLWFINDRKLQQKIVAFLAKNQQKYGVLIYALIIMGNHTHMVAKFPNANKAAFFQAFNSMIAALVRSMVPHYGSGKLWARPPKYQVLPENADIEHWFLYAGLNPVRSGLTQNYTEYDTFNSIHHAITGKELDFKLVNWTAYHNAKRVNKDVSPNNYEETYTLTFSRLPGYEHLSQREYVKMMEAKIEKRRCEMIEERLAEGKSFAGKEMLAGMTQGDKPKSTKTSTRTSKRPLVLTLNPEARKIYVDRYFCLLAAFREASHRYRNGALSTKFPPGTYRPPLFSPI